MFWDNMELWQKMLFVLACAIVVTLIIAIVKLIQDRLKVKKHIKETAQRKAELESQNAESQVNVVIKEKDEIPFGIRALEAGIEVEGVVVSRPGTPMRRSINPSAVTLTNSVDLESGLHTGTSTPRSSINHPSLSHLSMIMREQANSSPMRPVVYQPSPYMSFPAPVYSNSHLSSARSSVSSQNSSPALSRQNSKELKGGARPPFDQSGSDLSLPRPMFAHRSQHSSGGLPVPDLATLMRLTGRPTIEPRSNSTPDLPVTTGGKVVRHVRTPSPPETSLQAVREGEMMDSSSDTSTSGAETDNSLGLQNRPRPPRAKSVPLSAIAGLPGSQSKLSMLDTHRLSHAAEVGQIKRKVRGPPSQYYSGTNSRENIHVQSAPFDAIQAYGLDSTTVPMQDPSGVGVARTASDPTRPELVYMVDGTAERAAPSDWALHALRDAGIADTPSYTSGTSSVETLSRNNSSNDGSTTCGGEQAPAQIKTDDVASENDSEQPQPEKTKRKKLVKRSRASSVSGSEAASNKV